MTCLINSGWMFSFPVNATSGAGAIRPEGGGISPHGSRFRALFAGLAYHCFCFLERLFLLRVFNKDKGENRVYFAKAIASC